jgi:hypothetical protein
MFINRQHNKRITRQQLPLLAGYGGMCAARGAVRFLKSPGGLLKFVVWSPGIWRLVLLAWNNGMSVGTLRLRQRHQTPDTRQKRSCAGGAPLHLHFRRLKINIALLRSTRTIVTMHRVKRSDVGLPITFPGFAQQHASNAKCSAAPFTRHAHGKVQRYMPIGGPERDCC